MDKVRPLENNGAPTISTAAGFVTLVTRHCGALMPHVCGRSPIRAITHVSCEVDIIPELGWKPKVTVRQSVHQTLRLDRRSPDARGEVLSLTKRRALEAFVCTQLSLAAPARIIRCWRTYAERAAAVA